MELSEVQISQSTHKGVAHHYARPNKSVHIWGVSYNQGVILFILDLANWA